MHGVTQIFVILSIIGFFWYIIHILRKELIEYQYALMWLGAGLGMLFFAIFPEALWFISEHLGIGVPLNLVYFSVILLGLILTFQIIISISKMRRKIYELIQEVSMLKKALREQVGTQPVESTRTDPPQLDA